MTEFCRIMIVRRAACRLTGKAPSLNVPYSGPFQEHQGDAEDYMLADDESQHHTAYSVAL